MARTISPDYDRRREAIVLNAARLYAKSGFLGASLNDVAKACGSSKSLIYHYFDSKEDILFAVMSAHLQALSDSCEAVMATADGGPADQLRALARALMADYVGAAASQKVLLNELDNLPPDRRRAIVDQQRGLIATVETLLRAIRTDLPAHADLSRPIAMLFFGMINWTHTWYDPEGPLDAERFAELAVAILLDGLNRIKLADYAA